MLSKQPIEDLLKELQLLYDSPTTDPLHKDYYSKLALLELCGWLETVEDNIIENYSNSKLIETINKDFVKNQIIKKTYGFDYEKHFRGMLIKIIWLKALENLEIKIKASGNFQILEWQLSTLWGRRSSAAHTSLAGAMTTYDSPSIMLWYLNSLYPILIEIETEIML
jgi:hypothetical protein